jgi:hypothetical protein
MGDAGGRRLRSRMKRRIRLGISGIRGIFGAAASGAVSKEKIIAKSHFVIIITFDKNLSYSMQAYLLVIFHVVLFIVLYKGKNIDLTPK